MTDESDSVSLFAHPLTFLVTHVLFPLLYAGAVSYLYWLSCDGLSGGLALKAKALLGSAWALPLAALGALAARPERMSCVLLFVWAFVGTASLYLGVPLLGEMMRGVDGWVCGPTPYFLLFCGLAPLVFAGLARVATARWRLDAAQDIGLSFAMLVAPPAILFFGMLSLSACIRHGDRPDAMSQAILAHVMAVGFFLLSALFFIGLLRLLHKAFHARFRNGSQTAANVVCGLLLPLGGLALNSAIPFPADFQNGWAWGLAVFTGLVLLWPVRPERRGIVPYALRFVAAPFVLYFFVLFVPFLPLALLAILAMGAGFLILAPTLLFRAWSKDTFAAYKALRGVFSRRTLVSVGVAGLLVLPAAFIVQVERERRDLSALVDWHTKETFDELEPPPLPMAQARARAVMDGVNAYALGAEIPLLSAWRTFRVYGGLYMADRLRNELNRRVSGASADDGLAESERLRSAFGAGLFGFNSARTSASRGRPNRWTVRPPRTMGYAASASFVGTNAVDAVYEVLVEAKKGMAESSELVLDFRLPAGTWVEGLSLKMADGVWKAARASERKAAEWVYRKITDQRLDPSILTLDTPTEGRLRVFPVGKGGREVKVRLRRPADLAMPDELVSFRAVPPPPRSTLVWNAEMGKFETRPAPKAEPSLWQSVRAPAHPARDASARHEIVADARTGVSVVSAAWFARHAQAAAPSAIGCDLWTFEEKDPVLMSRLRRLLRFSATHQDQAPGVLPNVELRDANGVCCAFADVLSASECAVLRRELPGLEAFGDRPVDGWFAMPAADGRTVVVPYRTGENTLVFASLKDARQADAAWAEGAQAWALENEAFRSPGLDRRRELLDRTRRSGVLTTQSAYLVVETAAQEKGLRQKEAESLYAGKAMEFDESRAGRITESGDAPGFGLLLVALFACLWVCQKKQNTPLRKVGFL